MLAWALPSYEGMEIPVHVVNAASLSSSKMVTRSAVEPLPLIAAKKDSLVFHSHFFSEVEGADHDVNQYLLTFVVKVG
jgi:hypothetical protein